MPPSGGRLEQKAFLPVLAIRAMCSDIGEKTMATYLIERQLTLPGIQTKSAFYAQLQRAKEIEEARRQAAFENSLPFYEADEDRWPEFGNPSQHTNGVCEYVLIWSDGEDSRWAMTPSENPYL